MPNKARKDLMTTREAAAVLGVGTTSIKRWADDGVLDCIRTPGGHRRFSRASVFRVRGVVSFEGSDTPIAEWVRLLTRGDDLHELVTRIHELRYQRGDYWEAASFLGEVLDEVGRLWNTGEITLLEEHLSTQRMLHAVAAASAAIEVPDNAPAALLLVAEGDTHTLGLSLVELCLRDIGWVSRIPGAETPFDPVRAYVLAGNVQCVAISASLSSSNAASLADQARRYGELCRSQQIPLVLGGRGAWPDDLSYGHRVADFDDLRELAESGALSVN